MNHPPSVSVIIPTYNRSAYLRHAIASVLAQTWPDFEIVVVDDGSIDDTALVVAGFADPRIRYERQANAGRSSARNRGLQLTQGAYIALLDDDDWYLPTKLTHQVAFLEAHPTVDLVGGGTLLASADGALVSEWRTWEDQPDLSLPAALYALPLPTCALLARRQVLAATAEWFDPQLDCAEDTDWLLRLLAAGVRMAWLPEMVSVYRQHAHSSQHDAARYATCYLAMIAKFYHLPGLPPALWGGAATITTHYRLLAACLYYAADQIPLAQQTLCLALGVGGSSRYNERFAAYVAQQADRQPNPHDYIELVFHYLPSALVNLQKQRRTAHSLWFRRRIFAAQQTANQRPLLSDWIRSAWYEPAWLRERGAWSILVRDVVGVAQRVPRRV